MTMIPNNKYDEVVPTMELGQEGSMVTSRMKEDIFTLNGFGDFLWTLDPDIATMMIVAMVVGLGADNKDFMKNSSGGTR